MNYKDDPDAAAERLEFLANYEGSELGEVWRTLSMLWESYRDYISPEMQQILKRDIIEMAEQTHVDYKLVETEQTSTCKRITLVYTGD